MTRIAIAFLLLLTVADAAQPVANISGPEKARPGDIIILSFDGAADFIDWEVDASQVQIPVETAVQALKDTADTLRAAGFTVEEPKDNAPPVYLILDNKRLQLSSYEGAYRIKQAVSNAEGVDQTEKTITVGKLPKPPPVPPKPDPPIPPPVPVPTATLSKIAQDGVKSALTNENRLEFILLAGVYMSGADDAKSGKYATVDALLENVKKLTYQCMPTSVAAWKPTGQAIELQLDKMRDAGTLDTTKPASYEQPFREIGAGILSAAGVSP